MNFCDKLVKLRKEKNYSQEVLAEKMGLSRQAISKWESGAAYPDMEKINKLCEIFDCGLEDIVDDSAIKGRETTRVSEEKNFMKDFLDYITKSVNMFIAMTFIEKIKFLIEMFITFIVILFIITAGSRFAAGLIGEISYYVVGANIRRAIENFLVFIFQLITAFFGVIVFFHLYKIRYLDYYQTVEDDEVTEKKFEKPIVENREKKIIIRDPKTSVSPLMELLTKLLGIFIKFMFTCFTLPFIVIFILAIAFTIFMFSLIPTSSLFLYAGLAGIGASIIISIIIELVFRFVLSIKQSFVRYFITFMVSLLLIGSSVGLFITKLSMFEVSKDVPAEYRESINLDINVKSDSKIRFVGDLSHNNAVEYVIDNEVEGIKLEIKDKFIFVDYHLSSSYDDELSNEYIYLDSRLDRRTLINFVKRMIKENKYYSDFREVDKIIIKLSQDTYNRIVK